MEISDAAINTGFGLILARGIGDVAWPMRSPLTQPTLSARAGKGTATITKTRLEPSMLPRSMPWLQQSSLEAQTFTALFTVPPQIVLPLARAIPCSRSTSPARSACPRPNTTAARQNTYVRRSACRRPGPPALRLQPAEAALTVGNISPEAHIDLNGRPLPERANTLAMR